MNDPKAVSFFQDVANLRSNTDRLRGGEAPLTRKSLGKSFPFDELHHDEVTTVRQVSRVEDHRRVCMAQLGHRSGFAEKTIGDVGITGALTLDDLYCDGTFEIEVRGKVNRAHAAGPEFAFYSEPASDELGDIHRDLPSGKRPGATSGFNLGLGEEVGIVAEPSTDLHRFFSRICVICGWFCHLSKPGCTPATFGIQNTCPLISRLRSPCFGRSFSFKPRNV